MRFCAARRYDACAIWSQLWGRKKSGHGRNYVVVRARRRISRAGFHSLDFAGFESLMIRNRHQIGVPAADFGKQQRARAMTN